MVSRDLDAIIRELEARGMIEEIAPGTWRATFLGRLVAARYAGALDGDALAEVDASAGI